MLFKVSQSGLEVTVASQENIKQMKTRDQNNVYLPSKDSALYMLNVLFFLYFCQMFYVL